MKYVGTQRTSDNSDNRKLRNQVEKQISGELDVSPDFKGRSSEEILHELQVHQIELKIQNEELKIIQKNLEDTRDRYIDLYDFAPVGYFALSKEGLIIEANLTGATMLGEIRLNLINTRY